jgi:hypothetical protein
MLKKPLSLIFCVLCLNINAQTKVIQIENGSMPQNSIAFFLPKIQLKILVTYNKTTCKTAPFANYAKRLLALENVIAKDKTEYQIRDVNFSLYNIPDSSKYYGVEINSKSVAYKININKYGVLQSINGSEIKEYEPTEIPLEDAEISEIPQFKVTDTIFDYSCLPQEAIQATSIAKTAEIAAKQIFEIRENKMELLSGNSENKLDGNALKLAINRLDEQEAKLLELFTGKMQTEIFHKSFDYTPAIQNSTDEILFRFSSILGIVDKDDLAGKPIMIKIEPNIAVQNYELSDKKQKETGIPYNICGNGKFSIYDGNNLLNTIELQVPQFGHTAYLPAKLFNQKNTAVEFTEFGAIKSIR